MIDVAELRDRIQGMYAPPSSESAQDVIHGEGTHVTEVWEDGELTVTKSGSLYQQRRIHRSEPPFLPEGQVLFAGDEVDDWDEYDQLRRRNKHMRMVVTDDSLRDILAAYREFPVNQETIERCSE